MRSAREEHGFTLIEMLVGMSMSLIVMGAITFVLTSYLNNYRYDRFRDDAQQDAQVMIVRLSRELRSAASPSAGSAGLLEKATAYDLVFQTVSAGQVFTGNPTNQMRVRYCLGANNTLWRQTETWTSSTAPAVPDTSLCPSTSSSWVTASGGSPCCVTLSDITNEIGGDTTRPLFTYGPSGWTSTSQIQSVEVSLYIDRNPGHFPGPTQLTSGIFLRNTLAPPAASFTYTETAVGSNTRDIQLNGSPASDPNGQALTYQWYSGSGATCPSPTGAISGATTQQYDAGHFSTGTNQTFALVVTDTGGLTSCATQTIAVS